MSPEWQGEERRFGERDVTLKREGEVLHGRMYTTYPVDEPPLVEIPTLRLRLYASVWRRDGWEIA